MLTVYVCDWTEWQGACPAGKIADEGFKMVKLKVGGATVSRTGITRHWAHIDPFFRRSAETINAEPRLMPAAFWYLVPENLRAQAGLFIDLLDSVGWLDRAALILDVEEIGLNRTHVSVFSNLVWAMTGRKLTIYTNRSYWVQMMGPDSFGQSMGPTLEMARWVPVEVRDDPKLPYASQQASAIDPAWWNISFGGWSKPTLIQFTDRAKVADRVTCASVYRGTAVQMRADLQLD